VAANALRARGDVWLPTVTHVISYAVVMFPLGYVLAVPMGLGLDGIVWSVVVASLVAAALLLGRFALLARRPLG
jgi:multidrug resistance protein, MATE family